MDRTSNGAGPEATVPIRFRGGPFSPCAPAYVDAVDADLASRSWICSKWGYLRAVFRRNGKRTEVSLHRLILERRLGRPIDPGMFADHVNGDRLDNRRCNLREVTPAESSWNRGAHRTWRGVEREVPVLGAYRRIGNTTNPWRAQIRHLGRQIYLGVYATREEAVAARMEAEARLRAGFTRNTAIPGGAS